MRFIPFLIINRRLARSSFLGLVFGIVFSTIPTGTLFAQTNTPTITQTAVCPTNAWAGWTLSGFWHPKSSGPCLQAYGGGNPLWYGQDATCNYDNGLTNSGDAITPAWIIPAGGATLSFMSWEQTEGGSFYDTRQVYISTTGLGGPWTQLWVSTNAYVSAWYGVSVDVSAYSGQVAQFRFN